MDSDGSEHGEVHTYLIIVAKIGQIAGMAWNGRVLHIYETSSQPLSGHRLEFNADDLRDIQGREDIDTLGVYPDAKS